MRKKVLLLNLDYKPICAISARRAFLLTFSNKANIVDTYNGHSINTITSVFPYPSVIQLKEYVDNINLSKIRLNKPNIFRRDGYKCGYCGSREKLTLDHIIPISKGGRSTWENLVTCCSKCNSKKDSYNLSDTGMVLSVKPYKPTMFDFLSNEFTNDEIKTINNYIK